MRIYTMLATGFEEVEALAVVDLLKRANIEVELVSVVGEKLVSGAHDIKVMADLLFEEADFSKCDAIFLPGGMPGTTNLRNHKALCEVLLEFAREEKWLAAICAAPMVFGELGILDGKNAICFPGFESYLAGAAISNEKVVTDGKIVTSKGMGTAIDLGLELIGHFCGTALAQEIGKAIQYQ